MVKAIDLVGSSKNPLAQNKNRSFITKNGGRIYQKLDEIKVEYGTLKWPY